MAHTHTHTHSIRLYLIICMYRCICECWCMYLSEAPYWSRAPRQGHWASQKRLTINVISDGMFTIYQITRFQYLQIYSTFYNFYIVISRKLTGTFSASTAVTCNRRLSAMTSYTVCCNVFITHTTLQTERLKMDTQYLLCSKHVLKTYKRDTS